MPIPLMLAGVGGALGVTGAGAALAGGLAVAGTGAGAYSAIKGADTARRSANQAADAAKNAGINVSDVAAQANEQALKNARDSIALEKELTPEILAKKINQAEGRYFTTNKDIAKIFSKGKEGRVVEAEISKKDYKLGKKIRDKFFKFSGSTDDGTLLLPKKNLKDVKENIDVFKEKVGTIAATEYEKGGFIDMTKDKKYWKGVL